MKEQRWLRLDCPGMERVERIRLARKAPRAIAFLLVLLSACASPPLDLAEPKPAATPWCFAVTMRWDGVPRAALACSELRVVCETARSNAIRYRRFARVVTVGECGFNAGRSS